MTNFPKRQEFNGLVILSEAKDLLAGTKRHKMIFASLRITPRGYFFRATRMIW